ncbi:MAG: succinate dehydrogenase, cytochrome b556 subunit [Robiginitomaculum sp.]
MAGGWSDERPMSPHVSIWKWHPTMLSSILHRASGIVLYIGLLKICLFLAIMAAGPKVFERWEGLVYSPLGAFSFFVFTGILIFHLLNGIRHLVWDAGHGFNAKTSNMVSLLIILTVAIIAAGLTFIMVGSMS